MRELESECAHLDKHERTLSTPTHIYTHTLSECAHVHKHVRTFNTHTHTHTSVWRTEGEGARVCVGGYMRACVLMVR